MADNKKGTRYISASKAEEGEPNPRDMLKLYRQAMNPFDAQQTKLFMQMNPADRQELLFLMNMHTNKVLQYIHAKIDPQEAKTVAMPPPDTEH